MNKTFVKNLFRDIKGTLSRFLSTLIIIAVGVAFYAGVRATSPDMLASADYYFNKYNFMDFKIISPLGLTEDNIKAIRKISGITGAQGTYSTDAVIEKDQHSLVVNVLSLPGSGDINGIKLASGRIPEKSREAIVEERFLKQNSYKLGDKITLKSGSSDYAIGDKLKNNEFEIVGTADSPLFISVQRQLSSAGNGTVRGFVYVIPDVFKSDVFTEAYVRTNNTTSENSMMDNTKYKSDVQDVENKLKKVGTEQTDIRYNDIKNESSEKIAQGENDLAKSKKEADDKFAKANQQLADAKAQLDKGFAELNDKQMLFDKSMSDGEKAIAESKNQLNASEAQIAAKKAELDNGRIQLEQGQSQISQSEKDLIAAKEQSAASISSGVAAKIAELEQLLKADPLNEDLLSQYQQLSQLYQNCIKDKDFDTMYSLLETAGALDQLASVTDLRSLKAGFDSISETISTKKAELHASQITLDEGEAALKTGEATLEAGKKQLSDSEASLNKARQDGLAKLNEGKKTLLDSQKELDTNTSEFNNQKADAYKKLNDAENELKKNKDKVKNLSKQDWYVLGRSSNVGYDTYRQDSERIDNIGRSFPLIFFLVAALVSLTTMTRMVQEKRTEIGTFKALGYKRGAIIAHFMIYSLSASVTGSIIGILVGFKLFPPLIMNAYTSLYTIPYSVTPYVTRLALESSLLAIIFTTIATVMATLDELKEQPASLLRPKPPKLGKGILLEKITFIWKKLNFTQKVTARNIFRYKQRFFMTVIGIAACTGLLITGFGLKGSIIQATERQFNNIYKYDMQVSLSKNIDKTAKDTMQKDVMSDNNVKSMLFSYIKNSSVQKSGSKQSSTETQDAYLVVTENNSQLGKYINLTMNGTDLMLGDDGVIITEKLSKLVNKNVGDAINIIIGDKTVNAVISGITEQYVQHYIYMSRQYYEKLTGEKLQYNSFYGLLNNVNETFEDATASKLTSIENISSVSIKNKIKLDYGKSMDSINYVVLVLIISAGVLAFVVIYNLIDININERKSELATIKLLGFYNRELASYIYRENIILTIIGSILGIGLGIFESSFVIQSTETNIMMFYKKTDPMNFIYAILLTMLFSLIVNLIMYRRFEKIDMIESLKSPE